MCINIKKREELKQKKSIKESCNGNKESKKKSHDQSCSQEFPEYSKEKDQHKRPSTQEEKLNER